MAANESELRKAILAAASAMKINLANPENAFTLWSESPNGPIHCGGRSTLDEAIGLARQHVQMKNLVILSANPKHGLMRVADEDRIKSPKGAPGSGL